MADGFKSSLNLRQKSRRVVPEDPQVQESSELESRVVEPRYSSQNHSELQWMRKMQYQRNQSVQTLLNDDFQQILHRDLPLRNSTAIQVNPLKDVEVQTNVNEDSYDVILTKHERMRQSGSFAFTSKDVRGQLIVESLNIDENKNENRLGNQSQSKKLSTFRSHIMSKDVPQKKSHSVYDHKKKSKDKNQGPDFPTNPLAQFNDNEDDQQMFFQPLSYSKLMKMICTMHPVDPESKTKFDYKDRITVKDYFNKLTDCMYCYKLGQILSKFKRDVRKRFLKDQPIVRIQKPESMQELPDSNSDSMDTDEQQAKGLTSCAMNLGEGATLYLQMTKTFALIMLFLAIINIPIYLLYEQSTLDNDLLELKSVFGLFTIGNLGQLSKRCSHTSMDYHFYSKQDKYKISPLKKPYPIKFDCGEGYIASLKNFGFVYKFDSKYRGPTDGHKLCEYILDPSIKYLYSQPIDCGDQKNKNAKECTVQKNIEVKKTIDDHPLDEHPILQVSIKDDQNHQKIPSGDKDFNDYMTDPKNFLSQEYIDKIKADPKKSKGFDPSEVAKLTTYNLDTQCSYQNISNEDTLPPTLFVDKQKEKLFLEHFNKNCYEQSKCTIDLHDDNPSKLWPLMSPGCQERITKDSLTGRTILAIAGCKFDTVQIPLISHKFHKEEIGIILISLDALCTIIMLYFFGVLKVINAEYLDIIDDLRVQMKDFGVKIDNVILDRYTQDSRLVKMKAWLHFTKILSIDSVSREKADEFNDLEVVDICLSLYTQPSIQLVFRMQEIQLEINDINNKLVSNLYKIEQIPDKQEELKMLMEKKERFEKRYKQLIQKRKIKKNMNLTVTKIPKSQRITEIQYIFVVFKNCETADIVADLFQNGSGAINMFNQVLSSKKEDQQRLMLFNRQLNVTKILEPDEIIWENLAYTGDEQKVRRYIMQFVSILFILFNTLFTMYLGGIRYILNREIPVLNCQDDIQITKKQAFEDHLAQESLNLMGCYCSKETCVFKLWDLIPHNFNQESIDKLGKKDNFNYCAWYWGSQALKEISLFFISTSAVFINELVADLFQVMGQFQKKHTKIEEQETCFRQIFVQEFINMGLIILLTSFDRMGIQDMLMGQLAQKHKVYDGFESDWYMTYGNKICTFIFMSSFILSIKEGRLYIYKALRRIFDRSFQLKLKLDPEDEDCDKPNTRMRIQSDLEALYTGKPFKGEKAFSRMMSTLFVIQMYCGGMPIMYAIGFVFYTVTYAVNKWLIIKFYTKSRTLTRTVPLFAVNFLNLSIYLHLIAGFFMIMNPQAFYTKEKHSTVEYMFDITKVLNYLQIDTSKPFGSFLKEHLQFFHQQLYLIWIFSLVLFYFCWHTTKAVLLMLLAAIKKLLTMCKQKIVDKSKLVAQRIENNVMKSKMEIALQTHLKKQVMKTILERRRTEKRRLTEQEINQMQGGQGTPQNKIGLSLLGLKKVETTDAKSQETNELTAFMMKVLDRVEEEVQGEPDIEQLYQEYLTEQRIRKEKQDEINEIKRQEAEALRIKRDLQMKRIQRPDYSENIYKEFQVQSLSNFYERAKKEVDDFWDIFKWNREIKDDLLATDEQLKNHRILFQETCYTFKLTQEEVLQYQAFLLKRVKDIEETIDMYWDLLVPVLFKKIKEGFKRAAIKRKKEGREGGLKDQLAIQNWEKCYLCSSPEVDFYNLELFNYNKRLKILMEYQDDLIQADKERKENRRGIAEICRMNGSLTQSYFIFDSYQYKVAREIFYGIEGEEAQDSESAESDDNQEENPNFDDEANESKLNQQNYDDKPIARKDMQLKLDEPNSMMDSVRNAKSVQGLNSSTRGHRIAPRTTNLTKKKSQQI